MKDSNHIHALCLNTFPPYTLLYSIVDSFVGLPEEIKIYLIFSRTDQCGLTKLCFLVGDRMQLQEWECVSQGNISVCDMNKELEEF
jgi:hypothetical protein